MINNHLIPQSDSQHEPKSILSLILKIRLIAFLFLTLGLFFIYFLYRHPSLWICSDYRYSFFYLSLKFGHIGIPFYNLLLFLDGRFNFFIDNAIIATYLIFSLILITVFFGKFKRSFSNKIVVYVELFFVLTFIVWFCLYITPRSFFTAIIGTVIFLTYVFDFVVFPNSAEPWNKSINSKIFFIKLFTKYIFFSEIMLAPLFLNFICYLKKIKLRPVVLNSVAYLHFITFSFIFFLLFIPRSENDIQRMKVIKGGNYYGIAYFKKNSELFSIDEKNRHVETFRVENISNVIVPGRMFTYGIAGAYIDINEDRNEFYLVDKKSQAFIIVDLDSFTIKSIVSANILGDCGLTHNNNFLFSICEDPFIAYKIKLFNPEIVMQNFIDNAEGDINVYNKLKNVLYTGNIKNNAANKFYIYELDAESLRILRKVLIPSFAIEVILNKTGTKIFCSIPMASWLKSYIYILDAETFAIIDKIQVPFGTRAIAIDEKENLLFAGSATTNIIEVIDLNSKKICRKYKAGGFSLRKIVLDVESRQFFVSTKYSGIYYGEY